MSPSALHFRKPLPLTALETLKRRTLCISTGELLGTEPPPAVILINQVRESQQQHGDPERVPGGRQLRHAISISIRAKKPNQKEVSLDAEGNISVIEHNIKVRKNKVGPPFREATYHVRNDKSQHFFGVDIVRESVDLAVQFELLRSANDKKWSSGACFLFGEQIPIDASLTVPAEHTSRKNRFFLELLLYGNDEWYQKILVAVLEHVAASRFDDSIISVTSEFVLQNEGDESSDIMPGLDNEEE